MSAYEPKHQCAFSDYKKYIETLTNLKNFRSQVLMKMGLYGHKPTVEEAKKRFNEHVNGTAIIPADLRGPVYRIVSANGGTVPNNSYRF